MLELLLCHELLLCQELQDEIKRSSIFFLGTNTREMMNVSRISRVVVVAISSLLGGLNVNVQSVHYDKRALAR